MFSGDEEDVIQHLNMMKPMNLSRFQNPINPPHSQFYKNLVRRPYHPTGMLSKNPCSHRFTRNGRCPECGECFPVEAKIKPNA